jgi:glutaconyl-CoA/methylmalonyl-CoA decarboxylase subunit gamma
MKAFRVTVDGQSYTVQVEELSVSAPVTTGSATTPAPKSGSTAAATIISEQQKDSSINAGAAGGLTVKAPMPGSVIEVKVKEGDIVKNNDVLIILEAMKMENELTAPQAGTVSSVLVKKGDTVNSGDPLIILS